MQKRVHLLLFATVFTCASGCPSSELNSTLIVSPPVLPAKINTSHYHFNEQVKKLDGSGLVFAGAYSNALVVQGAPTKYAGWFNGTVQGQIDRDYFEHNPPAAIPNSRHDPTNDGAEFRWQDDYQAGAKPGPEKGSGGGQMRPRVKGIVRSGELAKEISKGEIWIQYEVWFEKGMLDFAVANRWSSQKTARIEDHTVRPHKGNHWTMTLDFNRSPADTEWKLRGYNKSADPTFAKPLAEGAWQRITVRTYDLGTSAPKVDVWHQDTTQDKADKIFAAEVGNWSAQTAINQIALMNDSSGHGGDPFPDHDFSVLWRHWIVSTQPIDLGESSIGN